MRLSGTQAAYLLCALALALAAGAGVFWYLAIYQAAPPPPPPPPPLAWSEATSTAPWQARDSAETFVFGGKLFIVGGLDANKVAGNNFVPYWEMPHFNDIWYTTDGREWTEGTTTAPWPPRRSMSITEFKGVLWMFGGWSPIGGYQADLWRSDDGLAWQKVGIAPWPPREGQMAEVFQGRLYMLGGVNYDTRKEFNDVWYTEDGTTWVEAPRAPFAPRWDHATVVFNDMLYVVAGMDLKGSEFGDVWTTSDGAFWTQSTTTPAWQTRQGHAMAVLDDKLWLFGRLNDALHGGTNDMWVSEDGVHWQLWGDLPWIGREDFNAEVFNDAIWMMAGMGSDWRWKSDVWRFGRPLVPPAGIAPTSTP